MAASEKVPSADVAKKKSPAGVGSDLRLSLTCPQCASSGWVEWHKLKRGLRCPKCRCEFLIDRTGQVLSQAEMRQVHFRCPRCNQSGSVPAALSIRKAECGACRLPLVSGPDNRLHGVEEVAAMRRAANMAAKQRKLKDRLAARFHTEDGQLRRWPVVYAVVLILVVLVLAGWGFSQLFDNSTTGRIRDFTQVCLAGKWKVATREYLPDDAVQRAEFDRWRVRYFSSILDAHRPKDDEVEIEVEPIEAGQPQSPQQVFRVTLKSTFIGERSHEQVWRLEGEAWSFDVLATLARTDRLPRQNTPGNARIGGLPASPLRR